MTPLPTIFSRIVQAYHEGHYDKLRRIQRQQEPDDGFCFTLEPAKPKKKKLSFQHSIEQAQHYMLYQWFKSHNDPRYKDVLEYVFIPRKVKCPMKDVSFDELLAFLSPETIESRAR